MRTGEYHELFDYSPIVDRPPLRWPNGARVALWVVPNIEHYELTTSGGGWDVRWASRTDYGNRVGVWRLMDVLDRHGIRGTVALNAAVCWHYPRIIEEALKRGWEMMGHSVTNSELLSSLPPEDQRTAIHRTIDVIQEHCRQRVRGWLGPALSEGPGTLDLLAEAGIEYVCDWTNDDQPYRLRNGLYSIPYTVELNDIPVFRDSGSTPAEFGQMIRDAFDTLYADGERQARVMCVALHPFLTGAPHRVAYVDKALEYICSFPGVWRATGAEIIDAYKEQAA